MHAASNECLIALAKYVRPAVFTYVFYLTCSKLPLLPFSDITYVSYFQGRKSLAALIYCSNSFVETALSFRH